MNAADKGLFLFHAILLLFFFLCFIKLIDVDVCHHLRSLRRRAADLLR